MRYLVLSDIHANLEALDACLADAQRRGFDQSLVLGDLVGYGADPNAVIDRVIELAPGMARGAPLRSPAHR
jgi:predicted phosphodiesterase